jgi:hypothetical protein
MSEIDIGFLATDKTYEEIIGFNSAESFGVRLLNQLLLSYKYFDEDSISSNFKKDLTIRRLRLNYIIKNEGLINAFNYEASDNSMYGWWEVIKIITPYLLSELGGVDMFLHEKTEHQMSDEKVEAFNMWLNFNTLVCITIYNLASNSSFSAGGNRYGALVISDDNIALGEEYIIKVNNLLGDNRRLLAPINVINNIIDNSIGEKAMKEALDEEQKGEQLAGAVTGDRKTSRKRKKRKTKRRKRKKRKRKRCKTKRCKTRNNSGKGKKGMKSKGYRSSRK